jgi:hypothetical protein
MNNDQFICFTNGLSVSIIKKQAKILKKNNSALSLSQALNALVSTFSKKSYNKAISSETTLELPLSSALFEKQTFISIIKSHSISISGNFTLDFWDVGTLGNPSKVVLDKHVNGWSIPLVTNSKFDTGSIELRITDEGVVADIYADGEPYDTGCVDINECISGKWLVPDNIKELESREYSDYEMSLALGATDDKSRIIIGQFMGLDIYLHSCLTIIHPEDGYLYGQAIIERAADVGVSKEQFLEWITNPGENVLKGWDVASNPYFEVVSSDGESVSDIFSELDINDLFVSTTHLLKKHTFN